MTALPAKTDFTGPTVTEGQFKTALEDLRDFLSETIGDVGGDGQWNVGATPTFVSTVSFTLVGDVTAEYQPGRRIRCTDASTLYGVIVDSAFTSLTTVTVALDSGVLSGSLTAVSVGIITPTNSSLPTPVKTTVLTSTDAAWTPAVGAKAIKFTAVGGGGGGGGVDGQGSGTAGGGSGGGGGGACIYTTDTIDPTYNITIGAAGAAGAAAAGDGGNGGSTTVVGSVGPGTNVNLTANGGSGGSGNTASASSGSREGGNGGTSSGGDLNISGEHGTMAITLQGAVSAGVVSVGNGGGSIFGGRGKGDNNGVGEDGTAPGGGGGGAGEEQATTNNAGGAGAAGVVIIEEFF